MNESSVLKFYNVQVGILRHYVTTQACSCTFRMWHKMSQLSDPFLGFNNDKTHSGRNPMPFTYRFERPGRWQFSFTPGIAMSFWHMCTVPQPIAS